jgi:hypothetical protein
VTIFTLAVTCSPYMKTTTFWKSILLPSSGGDDMKKFILHLGTPQYDFEVSILPLNHMVISIVSQNNRGLNCKRVGIVCPSHLKMDVDCMCGKLWFLI